MNEKILVVDDDQNILRSVEKLLTLKQYRVTAESNPLLARRQIEQNDFNCLLLDVRLPGMSGLELLQFSQQNQNSTPVIMISGQSNIETAVQAIKIGAFDFIEKPVDPDRLLVTLKNAINKQTLQEENEQLQHEVEENFRMVGKSKALQNLNQFIKSVAPTDAKVLITGETGTGKGMVASAIHFNSVRRSKPLIKLNCAAIPSELLESELFGHRKGAFTGAVSDHPGKFQVANGGTLFLDEIGDMDLNLQSKILRVLEEGEIEVIGENVPRKVNVRILAATNKLLPDLMKEGKFREDLYHRLNVIQIIIPPLREREEDILPIVYHFLNKNCEKYNRQVPKLDYQAEEFLINYSWPGNVRQVQNIIEKLVIFSKGAVISIQEVRDAFGNHTEITIPGLAITGGDGELMDLKKAIEQFKRHYIMHVLEMTDGKKNKTSEILGIDRTSLFRALKSMGIEQ